MGFLLWILPLLSVPVFALLKQRKAWHAVSIITSAAMLAAAAKATVSVINTGLLEYAALGGLFHIDPLSIIIIDIVVVIGFLAAVFSMGYLNEELKHGKIEGSKIKLYYMLMYVFMFTMIFALSVRNMGIMWIAIEATTLASAFLVGFYNDKRATEATWKYVIICSVGIAVAMLGIIFLHLSSTGLLEGSKQLDWTALYGEADKLKSPLLRLAFIFILVGFGTKAGLSPMHTWLPDAHSQSPSPISALLSGVLLNSAMYAIIRTVSIVNKNLGSSVFTGRILIAAGMLSIVTAALFILTQKDYKRLLAYSSIEHMGIIAVSIGVFTPAAVFAGLFHMINHSFTKSMLFLTSGSILQKYGTREISRVKGLLRMLPVSGTIFFLGLFAIAGTPPFSVFASEFNVMTAIFENGGFVLGAVFALLLALVFTGIAFSLFKIFWSSRGDGSAENKNIAESCKDSCESSEDSYESSEDSCESSEDSYESSEDSCESSEDSYENSGDSCETESDSCETESESSESSANHTALVAGETNKAGTVVIAVLLAVILFMGFYMPSELKELLTKAQQIIIGG